MEEFNLENLLHALPILAGVVMHMAMLIGPVYCIIRRPTAPAYVMLVGNLLGLPTAIFSLWFNLWGIHKNMPMDNISLYFGVTGFFAIIGGFMFAFGFLFFLRDALKRRVSMS
jgi:hypothetical protein